MGGLNVIQSLQTSQTRIQSDYARPDQIQRFQLTVQSVQTARVPVDRCDNKASLKLVIEKARQLARLVVSLQWSG